MLHNPVQINAHKNLYEVARSSGNVVHLS